MRVAQHLTERVLGATPDQRQHDGQLGGDVDAAHLQRRARVDSIGAQLEARRAVVCLSHPGRLEGQHDQRDKSALQTYTQ